MIRFMVTITMYSASSQNLFYLTGTDATTPTPTPFPSCYDGQLRLGNASIEFNSSHYNYQGRVEVCINGTFGAICDVGWDELDAQVACRQLLGFNGKELLLSHVQLLIVSETANKKVSLFVQDHKC